MAEYGKSRDVAAPAHRVWAIWSDPATWHEWNPNVSSMEMESPIALGRRGVMNTPAGQHHNMEIVDYQAGRSFTLETAVIPGSRFRFHCRVEPAGQATRVSQAVKVVGAMGWLYGPMMGGQVAKDFDKVLDGLARKAESSGG